MQGTQQPLDSQNGVFCVTLTPCTIYRLSLGEAQTQVSTIAHLGSYILLCRSKGSDSGCPDLVKSKMVLDWEPLAGS